MGHTRSSLRGRANDLKEQPGDAVLDRLVPEYENPQIPMVPNPLVIKSPKTQADKSPKVKVAFYLEESQRDELDLLLVKVRKHLQRPRRVDQSMLIRALLDGALSDFNSHPEKSHLLRWLNELPE